MRRTSRFAASRLAKYVALTAAGLSACLEIPSPTGPIEGAACAPRGPFMGSFEGTATGAVAVQMAGCAYFVVETGVSIGANENGSKMSMIMSNGEIGKFRQTIGLYRAGGRPLRGIWTLGPAGITEIYGKVRDNQTGVLYDITSGTMNVSQSNAAIFNATITFTATQVGGSAIITVSGSIIAACIDPNRPLISDEGKLDEQYRGTCDGGGSG